ncbi:MAG TPA: FkbM family methyltransferase [Candidatus Nanoarchaeia archaeon]|nr:FkbM family methyltransferase [Candidatus Nanoarchaeia archaeon]
MFNSIKTFLKIIKIYRNWPTVICDVLRLKRGNYICRMRNGLNFRVRSKEKDVNIINEVFISRSYHNALKMLNKESVVIDIGGHIGSFAILAGKIAKQGKVYSYEPFQGSYKILSENILLNELSNVKAYNLAVTGNKNKTIKLYIKTIGEDFAGNSLYGSGENVTVNTTNLAKIFSFNKIKRCDLLKIDCEGAEYEILYNTPRKIFDKINNIALEYHTPFGDHIKLKSYIEKMGFQVTETSKGVYFAYRKS